MVKISVLLENNSINKQYKTQHGLSVLINTNDKNILLDVGPDNKFIENARKMNIDISKIDYLFLSHNHNDHTGGINKFFKLNDSALIYLMDDVNNKYYGKLYFLNIPIGIKIRKVNHSKIVQLNSDQNIDNKIYFLKNTVCEYTKPTFNKYLFKKDKNKLILDDFEHEGILVIEDENELIVLNSCSHNGMLNIIKTVNTKIPNKKIRCYIGGLHLCNPGTKYHESDENLDKLIDKINKMDIIIYTGHCTGKYAINYMREKLGEKIKEINTGMILNV